MRDIFPRSTSTNPFIFYFVVRIFKKPLRITLKRKAR